MLREAGGLNPYGGSNFIVVWGEHGGDDTGSGLIPPQNGLPCWNLCVWHPAEDAGHPAFWPGELCGPYPTFGYYEIVQPMYRKMGTRLDQIEPLELNYNALELFVWILRKHQRDSWYQRKVAAEKLRDQRNSEMVSRIADCLQDSYPAFNASESFSGTPNTSFRKRMELIERNLGWNPPKGLGIGSIA